MACVRATALLLALTSILPCSPVRGDGPPLTEMLPRLKPTDPVDSLKTFRVAPGFRIELAACEPNVTDPVDMAWDENGKLYVCELWNYPGEPKPGEPLGRIRVLEDTHGDGVYDKSTIFADNIKWPSGILCWDGGVFVLSSPDLLYLKDTTGAGKADVKKRIFTGFRGKTYEVPNSLRWGPDGMIYVCGSYAGGKVTPVESAVARDAAEGRDFRFDARFALGSSPSIEAVSGGGEWGLAIDDFGNRFNCDATHLMYHAVLPREYLARNEFLAVTNVKETCYPEWAPIYPISPVEPWKATRQKFWSKWVNTSGDMNAGRFPKTELEPHGFATSAAGLTIYRGSAYGREYAGNAFIGEPANNAVVRLRLKPEGVTFKAEHVGEETKTEFLASTDNWFRPVGFANGPDGCLYVIAMYREVIEDESAVPKDILKHLDLYSGRERGRIYRIVPDRADWKRASPPKPGDMTERQWVGALASPDGWVRDTAQRLILQKAESRTRAQMRSELAGLAASTAAAQARVQALWTIAALQGSIRVPEVEAALGDADPLVRESAIWITLARCVNGDCGVPFLADRQATQTMIALADDAEPRVRFAVAFALGSIDDPNGARGKERFDALARLARRDGGDRWARAAILCSVHDKTAPLFQRLWDDEDSLQSSQGVSMLGDLAQIIGSRADASEVSTVLARLSPTGEHAERSRSILRNLAEGMSKSGSSLADYFRKNSDERASAPAKVFFDAARKTASDGAQAEKARLDAIGLMAFDPFHSLAECFDGLLAPAQPQSVQAAAIRAIARRDEDGVGQLLVDHWKHLGPAARPEVIDALVRRPQRIVVLLDAMEKRLITPADLGPSQKSRLARNEDTALRARARKLLGPAANPDRQHVIDQYRAAIKTLAGDGERGRAIFQATCFQCHAEAPGHPRVGPNLGTLEDRSPDTLLISILDPNRDVKPIFVGYTLVTTDGLDYNGVIAAETASSLTLRHAGGEETILRKNLKSLTSNGVSLMPEGLEAGINEQQMADLIAFLQTYREK